MKYVRYHGPGHVLELGEKRLLRGGEAVELTDEEFERTSSYRGRRLEVFEEEPARIEPRPKPRAQVTRSRRKSRPVLPEEGAAGSENPDGGSHSAEE